MELGFQHVGVYCRNIDESIAFYEDVFGCRLLFRSDAMEGDKPLKMAWIKGMGIVFELLECEDKSIEAGPFDPPLEFDRPLADGDSDVFATYGTAGTQLRIMFFRGPGGERFEVVQDNIKAL